MTSSLQEADGARGARVEIAMRAAEDGDYPTAAGILAGMSAEERDAFGPWITAAAQHARARPRGERHGPKSTSSRRLDKLLPARDDETRPYPPWLMENR